MRTSRAIVRSGAQPGLEGLTAKWVPADIPLSDEFAQSLIDPAQDAGSRPPRDSPDREAFQTPAHMTAGEFWKCLLDCAMERRELQRPPWATPPVAVKLMNNKDLVLTAGRIRAVTRCPRSMDGPGCWVSVFSPIIQR